LFYVVGAITLLVGGSLSAYLAYSQKRPYYGILLFGLVVALTALEGAFRASREAEKPRPDWSSWKLLNHQISVLRIESDRLHSLFTQARDSDGSYSALSPLETVFKYRIEPIVQYELVDYPYLCSHFYDDTGFPTQVQYADLLEKTKMANFLERRVIRLRDAIDFLEAEKSKLNVTRGAR
jgi:hypothetical protein